MDSGSDAEIIAAVSAFIGGREAGEVLDALYHPSSAADDAGKALAGLLPDEQISVVRLVDRQNLTGLPAVVVLLVTLRKIRTDESWIHYNLADNLRSLVGVGVQEATLPAIIHSLLALEGLKDNPSAQPLPIGVLSRGLANIAPREAIRYSMLACRYGDQTALERQAPFAALGLKAIPGRPTIAQLLHLAKELHLSTDNVPAMPQATSLGSASGLRSTMIEPPRRVTFPAVRGDASHYIFGSARKEVSLPGITVHALEGGVFSIDASQRGLERHYAFDRNGDCVLDFANGADPFIAETVLECDGPVAVLEDRFSGVLNISHFLLDRVTRIPLYERAWSRPGKFLLVDDFQYCRDIFAHLGLADRIITPSSKRVSIRAAEILLSSNIAADFRHPAHYCSDWAIKYLRDALGIEERPARPGRKLMISRADTRGRGILNWDEVLPVLARYGFEVVELGNLTTEAQIASFREVSQVVGVHGAGLTNVLFAPRDCAVLEILPPLVAVHDYWLLASALGQHYSALIADDPELSRPDYRTWQHNDSYNNRDIVLPVDRLEAALAALDDATNSSPGKSRAAPSAPWRQQPDLMNEAIADTLSRSPVEHNKERLPDLILCHCSGYKLTDIESFIASFLRLDGPVQLCMFASGMDDRFYEVCANRGIRIEPAVDHFDRQYHIQNARFFEYNTFLADHTPQYRKVMITDVRDVFFQSNPFNIDFSHEICFAAEDRIISDEHWNRTWIKDIYGEEIFDEICGEIISCSGTTLGTASAMKAYITLMCQELSWRQYDYLRTHDQGIHNYIAWKIRPGFARVDLDDRIFSTIGLADPKRIEIAGDIVLVDGAAPPVIHQWDRHEKLKEFVRSSPFFHLGEPSVAPVVEPVSSVSEGEPQDFWGEFRSYHTAAAAGDHESALAHLDSAASFPAEQALPALTDRARRRFLAGDIPACWADVERGLGAVHSSSMAKWFKKDLAFMGALCRYAMQDGGTDELLRLMPEDDPIFDEKLLQGPTMARLEAQAQPGSDLLIERYLATKQRLHHNAVSWPSLLESFNSEDIVLQVGAMDGVTWDPVRAAITRLNSPGVLVEPVAEMFQALKRNYSRNTRLVFANVAIAEASGPQTIYRVPPGKVSEEWLQGISTLRKPHSESAIAPIVVPETIRGLTFADFCQEFTVTHFDLLQIDTEGYDWKILRQIDLRRFGTRIVRLEYSHLPLEDRIRVIEHLEAAGLTASCDDVDFWAGKV